MAGLRAALGMWAGPPVLQFFAVLSLASSLLFALVTNAASAQSPQQNALARTLFEDGVALADKGDWVGAADRFSRAYSLKPTSGVAFNWASVLLESGELLHAQELLLAVQRDPSASGKLKQEADKLIAALVPRLARLRVRVLGTVDAHVTVELDGQGFPSAAWDMLSPVDPGVHSVVLKRDQHEQARADLTLGEGEQQDVSLQVPDVESVAVLATPTLATVHEESRDTPLYKSWMVWTGVGVVVVAGVVTAAVLATRKDEQAAAPVMGNTLPGVLRW